MDEIEAARQEELTKLAERKGKLNLAEVAEQYLNPYGYREVLHTSFIFAENVGMYLLDHPCVIFDPEAYRLASIATDTLHDLYQRIGQLEAESEEK